MANKTDLISAGFTRDIVEETGEEYKAKNNDQLELYDTVHKMMYSKDPDKDLRVFTVTGSQGVGKTYTICRAVIDYLNDTNFNQIDSYCRDHAKYVTHSNLDLELKSALNPGARETQFSIVQRYSAVPILIVDEVGRGSRTDYSMGLLENIISNRYANKLKTILITNNTGLQLHEMFDPAILDRIGNFDHATSREINGVSLR